MKAVIEKKKNIVDNLKQKIDKSAIVYICDYKGSSVEIFTNFRGKMKGAKSELKVYKNTLTRRALAELSIAYPEEILKGNTVVITTEGDPVESAKVIKTFFKENETFKIKGGFLKKVAIKGKDVEEIATLPPKEVLIAKLVGQMKSPINLLVGSLSSPLRGLVYVLNSILEKKQEEEKNV